MNKKTKLKIFLGTASTIALFTTIGVGVGIGVGNKFQNASNISNYQKPNLNVPSFIKNPLTVNNDQTMFSLERLKSVESEYKISIIQSENDQKYGTIVFVDEKGNELGSELIVKPSQKLFVKAKINDDQYTLTNLKVYNKGESSIQLAVQKNNDIYSFTLPEEKIKDQFSSELIDNPFYKNKDLIVESVYGKVQLNKWKFDFETKTYSIEILENNYIFDDVTNPELKMLPGNGELIQYRIYLNNNNLNINNITVPNGAQLMFINNKENTNDSIIPQVEILERNRVFINGAIGRYGSVKFGDKLHTTLGLR